MNKWILSAQHVTYLDDIEMKFGRLRTNSRGSIHGSLYQGQIKTYSSYGVYIGHHWSKILVPVSGASVKSLAVCNVILQKTRFQIDYNLATKPKYIIIIIICTIVYFHYYCIIILFVVVYFPGMIIMLRMILPVE